MDKQSPALEINKARVDDALLISEFVSQDVPSIGFPFDEAVSTPTSSRMDGRMSTFWVGPLFVVPGAKNACAGYRANIATRAPLSKEIP